MALIRVFFVIAIAAVVTGCFGAKGMDKVISVKELDKLQTFAQEMASEEAAIFEQTVIAEVNALSMQLGLMLMAEGLATNRDPSRDAATPKLDDALQRLQAFDGKTARAATIEILQAHLVKVQAEKNLAVAAQKAMGDIEGQLEKLDFKVKKVEIKRDSFSGRTTDSLSLVIQVAAPDAPPVYLQSFRVTPRMADGTGVRAPISITKSLLLPCSECELFLHSSADPAGGYASLPREVDAYSVQIEKWSPKNGMKQTVPDLADFDQRVATLERKIALVSNKR